MSPSPGFDLTNILLGLAWLGELDRRQIKRLWIEIGRRSKLSGFFVAHELRLDPQEKRPICDALVVMQFGTFDLPNIVPWSSDPAIEDERPPLPTAADYELFRKRYPAPNPWLELCSSLLAWSGLQLCGRRCAVRPGCAGPH